jgi:hypothetical protein
MVLARWRINGKKDERMTQPPRVDLFDAAFKADPYPT